MREQDDLTPDSPDSRDLEEAAHSWGIETSYWDVWGREHRASPVVETAILRSLGVDGSSRASLLRAREERDQRRWLSPLPPNVFLAQGQPSPEIPVSLPIDRAGAQAVLTLHLEDGSLRVLPIPFSEIPVAEEGAAGGRRFVRKQISLEADLPLGYHRLSLEIAGEAAPPARLIVYPSRTYQPEWLKAGRAGRCRDQPLRTPFPTQLGLRRYHRFKGAHRLGCRAGWRELHQSQSAARHPQPPPL